MSELDTRGFVYPLEAALRRAGYRVEAAMGLLGMRLQTLDERRQRVQELLGQCQRSAESGHLKDLAQINPQQALTVARHVRHLLSAITDAKGEVRVAEREVEEARRTLERAQMERDGFDSHREAALKEFAVEFDRKRQAAIDDDWLSRRHAEGGAAVNERSDHEVG